MKIIEGLKKIQDLRKKVDDLRNKIAKHSAYLSYESPVYENQPQQISEWLQAHSDILKEILKLRIAIQKTNLATSVTIELDGKQVTKSIAEWIHRRKDLAVLEKSAWASLTDRNLQEGTIKKSTGDLTEVKIIRCYSPSQRDAKVGIYDSEPSIIDGKLEIVNAVTDLLEE